MIKPSYARHVTSGRLALALALATSSHVFLKDFTQDAPAADPLSVADLVDNVRSGTVFIGVNGKAPAGTPQAGRSFSASGSGFVIDGQNGYIVTNNHVIEAASGNDSAKVEVTLINGKKLTATIVGRDTVADIAVLQVKSDFPLPTVKFGDSAAVRIGDSVIAIGNPYGLVSTTTSGIVSALNREVGDSPYDDMIQTDASINSGNSGGALFNKRGEVVGVNTSIFSPTGGSVGLGFSIPSNRVLKIAGEIIANGDIQHGWLGVSMQDMSEEISKKAGMSSEAGIFVKEVAPNGPAQTAGLKAGDVILEVNGKKIESPKKLSLIVIDSRPGSDLDVLYWRDGTTHTMKVKLGNYETLQAMLVKDQPPAQKPPMPEPSAP